MDKVKLVLRAFFESVKVSLESFILPTGKYLLPSLVVAIVILIVTVISTICGLFTLTSIPGALLGVLVLAGIYFVERGERHEISNFYRTAQTRVQAVIGRKEGPSSSEPAQIDGSNPEPSASGDTGSSGDDGHSSDTGVADGSPAGNQEFSSTSSEGLDDRDLD